MATLLALNLQRCQRYQHYHRDRDRDRDRDPPPRGSFRMRCWFNKIIQLSDPLRMAMFVLVLRGCLMYIVQSSGHSHQRCGKYHTAVVECWSEWRLYLNNYINWEWNNPKPDFFTCLKTIDYLFENTPSPIPYNCHFFYTDTIFVRIKFTPKNADFSR